MTELTENDLYINYFIKEDQKKKPPNNLNIDGICTLLTNELNASISNEVKIEIKNSLKRYQSQKKRLFTNKHLPIDWDKIGSLGSNETIILTYQHDNEEINLNHCRKRSLTPLKNLESRKQLLRRTDQIWEQIQTVAQEENTTASELLGLLLTRCADKSIRNVGNSLWHTSQPPSSPTHPHSNKINTNTALVIYTDCNLGRQSWTTQKRVLAADGHDILPAWKHLRNIQAQITPVAMPIPSSYLNSPFGHGVYFNMIEALKSTLTRIIQTIPEPEKIINFNVTCKFGFDGSGGHSIFNQKNNDSSNNLILTVMCPLELKDSTGKVIWTESAPNSHRSQRPLLIRTGKESVESLGSLKIFNNDINKAENEGFVLNVAEDRTVNVKSTIIAYSLDRKAANLYLGLGGAYCDLCELSKEDCLDIDTIKDGISITRDIDTLHSIFDHLEQEDGSICKNDGDYPTRTGLTNRPIATNPVKTIQVLHGLMRSCNVFMKIVVHVIAAVYTWTESKSSHYHTFLESTKRKLQKDLDDEYGIKWDFADSSGQNGSTTTGNICRRLLFDEKKSESS